jgi:phosphatidylserine/phosphatidylglycerophosphate/cardiolipin synthase-like enzyme
MARVVVLSLLAALVSCGAPAVDVEQPPEADAGVVDEPDAGTPAQDAGSIADDAGVTPEEAGGTPSDAGTVTPPPDAGADAGMSSTPDAGPPTYAALFSTRSSTNAADATIESFLVSLIDQALPGSTIRIALFTFTRAGPSSALVRAHNRGVDVKVVLDGDNVNSPFSELSVLRTGLGTSRVHVCDAPGTACVGSGIMHHKTFLFSALADGSRNVVVQASHNLTTGQTTMHNNAVVIRGDAALYAAYLRTWNDLVADVEIPDYYRVDDGSLGSNRVYFFPRPTGGDTSVSILNNITCDSTARVRVAMAFFTDARVEVAQALAARKAEGCDVRVVAGDDEIPLGSSVASTLTAVGVELTRYPARSGSWGLHSKYLLIDAKYAGSTAHRRLVFTGSHNWTGPALTINDETLLRVEDDGVFTGFLADWAHVRASAVRP